MVSLYEEVAIAAMDFQCLDVAKDSVKVLQRNFPVSIRVGRLEALLLEASGSWAEAENAYSSLLEGNPLDQTIQEEDSHGKSARKCCRLAAAIELLLLIHLTLVEVGFQQRNVLKKEKEKCV